jgi:hypothetical protein
MTLALFLCACIDSSLKKGDDFIDLDQDVTNDIRPKDSIFIDFEKNWQKFISPVQEFTLPVYVPDEQQPEVWDPLIFSGCVFSEDAGGKVAQVELQWQGVAEEKPMRFDISLQYQGFEQNYYTAIMADSSGTRFNIPQNSTFLKNEEALLLVGTPLFPKMMNYSAVAVQLDTTRIDYNEDQKQEVTTDDSGQVIQQDVVQSRDINMVNHKLLLQDLGYGLSYKIRMCTLEKRVWRPTQEYVFSTPICPIDDYEDN